MVSAFVLAALIGVMAVIGLGLDPGEAFAAKIHSIGDAEEAARAGAQQIDLTAYRTTGTLRLDAPDAEAAAQKFLATQGETGAVTVDGDRVTVTITTAYRTQLWQLVGVDTIAVHATGSATATIGVTGPDTP